MEAIKTRALLLRVETNLQSERLLAKWARELDEDAVSPDVEKFTLSAYATGGGRL